MLKVKKVCLWACTALTATCLTAATAISLNAFAEDETVNVQSLTLGYSTLELGESWTTRIGYTIAPADATVQSVTWSSSDEKVVTVDENGYVTAVGEGDATITVTPDDTNAEAQTCAVTVIAEEDLNAATLSDDLQINIGGSGDFTVTVAGADENTTYRWYAANDAIASPDTNEDETGTVTGWAFGTTTVYVLAKNSVTDSETGKTEVTYYAAEGSVLVKEDYFYLTGIKEDWSTYETEAEAKTAGVLLNKEKDGVYSIECQLWAYDGFQILPSNMDANWTTKITPDVYYETETSAAYVANANNMFMVNALGTYTVTLNLTYGYARVYIEMVSLDVTSVELTVAEGSVGYLQNDGDQVVLNVTTLPKDAVTTKTIEASVLSSMEQYVNVSVDNDKNTITVTLIGISEENIVFTLTCKVGDAVGTIELTVYGVEEEKVAVSSIAFTSEQYTINVNNGGSDWSTEISASVNESASIQGVTYTTSSDNIYVEYNETTDKYYVRASALGTYTVTATAIGDSNYSATATVYVYSDTFYLIGILGGETVASWTSVKPEVQTLEGTDYEKWALSYASDGVYEGKFTLLYGDTFSIAFLGMNGNWDGVINNSYIDETSDNYWESGINVQINVSGVYTIKLDLTGETPIFKLTFEEEAEDKENTYDLYVYIVASGSAWDSSLSQEGNIIATVGYIQVVKGVMQSLTVTLDSCSFASMSAWPTIQIVTAKGIDGGYFVDATWYGSSASSVKVSGGAYGNESDQLYNGGSGCEFWWVGSSYQSGSSYAFTFTFNEDATLATIAIEYVG